MFGRSIDYRISFKNLISDGDSKTHSLIPEEQPYGPETDNQIKKKDCVGHVLKCLGTAVSMKHTGEGNFQTAKQLVEQDD